MRNFLALFFALPFVGAVAVAACSSGGNATDTGGACVTVADCPKGLECGYPSDGGCSATGVCMTIPTAFDAGTERACGCQGQSVTYVASGYTSQAVSGGGVCSDDAGVDAAKEVTVGTDAASDGPPVSAEAGADGSTDGAADGAADGGTDASSDGSSDAGDAGDAN